jgi:hypothetical protein
MARRPRLDRDLDRSLVPGERAIVAVRHHWLSLSREIGAAVAATVLAFVVDVKVPTSEGGPMLLHNLSLLLWWGTMGWLVWTWLNWRREWFVATDKRFLLFYGFIRRKVAMMPLTKVTDMTFDQSLLGRIVGYGTFVMESAGQGQALSVVAYVPNAQVHYQAICSELFGTTVAEAEAQAEGGAGPGGGAAMAREGPVAAAGTVRAEGTAPMAAPWPAGADPRWSMPRRGGAPTRPPTRSNETRRSPGTAARTWAPPRGGSATPVRSRSSERPDRRAPRAELPGPPGHRAPGPSGRRGRSSPTTGSLRRHRATTALLVTTTPTRVTASAVAMLAAATTATTTGAAMRARSRSTRRPSGLRAERAAGSR